MKLARPTRVRHGITLTEVLVTISIIVVLLALLLPAMTVAKESLRRIKCLSNIRQMGIIGVNYGTDHEGWLPPFIRKRGGSMHLGYMTSNAYREFDKASDIEGEVMTCPSNPEPPKLLGEGSVNEVWSTTIRYMGGWDCTIGSFFQGPSGDFWPGGDLPYYSPLKFGGAGGQVIFADSIYRRPFYNHTSANHGPIGFIEYSYDTHPAETAIEGANVGLLDGSARFKVVSEMDCDPLSIPGYMKWFQLHGGGPTMTNLPGQGWNRTHNASYGQWYF